MIKRTLFAVALIVLAIILIVCVQVVRDIGVAAVHASGGGFALGDASVIFRADGGYVYQVEIYYPDGYYQVLRPEEEIAPAATATPETLLTIPPTNTPRPIETPVGMPTPEPLSNPPYCEGRVTMMLAVELNVRASPWGVLVGKLYKGAGVSIYAVRADGQGDDWYQIAFGAGRAWVYADYIDVGNCGGLPRA